MMLFEASVIYCCVRATGTVTIHSVWREFTRAVDYAAKLQASHPDMEYTIETEPIKKLFPPAVFSLVQRVKINGALFELQE